MLTISTIPEALAELDKRTGREWTSSELLDLAAHCGIELHAAPPITAQTTIQKFVDGKGMVEKFRSGPGHSLLAVLFPWQVAQLLISGETVTSHPSRHDEVEGEYQFFTEPVQVTREQVRIKAATLEKILTVWSKAQPAPEQLRDATTPPAAPQVAVGASGGTIEQAPDPERRLVLLRELGGGEKYARGEWRFTGIAALVAKEKADGRKRCDQKTIRADLKEAAQTERDAKNAGFATGLGKL